MLNEKKAILLIGSPKIRKSSSEALGGYLLDSLHNKGYTTDKLHIASTLKKDIQELLDKVRNTDLLIIAFPLYIDSLPAPLIRAFELILEDRKENKGYKEQSIISIINCGFPEALQNNTALRICENFASKADFDWLGGLVMGGGPVIDGRPLKELGGMARNIVKAIDIAAEAIANDKKIPQEAVNIMSKRIMPAFLYTFGGNMGWKSMAKKHNVHKQLYSKPYISLSNNKN